MGKLTQSDEFILSKVTQLVYPRDMNVDLTQWFSAGVILPPRGTFDKSGDIGIVSN